jgi:hypothetical protein
VQLPIAFSPAIAAVIVRCWITKEGFGDAGLALHLRRARSVALRAAERFILAHFVLRMPPHSRLENRSYSFSDSFRWSVLRSSMGRGHCTLGWTSAPSWLEGLHIRLQAIHPPATTSSALPRVWAAPICTPAAINNPVGA